MSFKSKSTVELLNQYESLQDFIESKGLGDEFERFYADRIDALDESIDLPDTLDKQIKQAAWKCVNVSPTVSRSSLVTFLSREYPKLVAWTPAVGRLIEEMRRGGKPES